MINTDEANNKNSIILDTNILQYFGNKHIGPLLRQYLQVLRGRNFTLSISEVTIFESLAFSKRHQEDEIVRTLNQFLHKPITKEVLVTSSWLSKLYIIEQIPLLQISTEDKILGATALLTNSLIVTANVNDFPRPFFKEKEEELIFYRYKNKKRMIAVYLLEPNLPVIQERFDEI